jgi:hypothetical protein
MTASTNPDENSYPPKEAGSRESAGFVYDDPNLPQEAESSYVPEREFVLMPLFRRIGELLGVRRHQEPEYTYASAPETQHTETRLPQEIAGAAQHEPALAHEESTLVYNEPVYEEPTLAPESVQDGANHWESRAAEPLPEVVSDVAEPIALHSAVEAPQTSPAPRDVQEEVAAASAHFEPSYHYEGAAEAHIPETLPQVVEAASASTQPPQLKRQKTAPRRPDEIDQAIAILREAGSKISATISQAVEWLSAKEAELVRQAERTLAPAPRPRRVQAPSSTTAREPEHSESIAAAPIAAASGPEIAPEAPSANSEPLQFPGLQREVAWQGQSERVLEQPAAKPRPVALPTYSAAPRPALVPRRPRVPFWKRIDWAAEFTPKRVAVLGGVVMAMLIVAGITFARRPASEVLPPQAHSIQSGGVTVTTHPAATTAAPVPQQHRTLPPVKRAVAPASHRAPRAAVYDEPDVVTHYYKQKPSPSKQSTVAGVKHYSDTE